MNPKVKSVRPPKQTLKHLYLQDRLSTRQIAKRYEVSGTTVKRWLRIYDIPRRANRFTLEHREVTEPTVEKLYSMVHVEHLSYREIARRLDVSTTVVSNRLKTFGIEKPTVWQTRRKGSEIVMPDESTLRHLYETQQLSQVAVGDVYGVSGATIANLMKRYGITARLGGFDGGIRHTCKDGHQALSGYERRVDDWLYSYGVPHEHEPRLPFDRRMKGDFLANGWYIEVWGVLGNRRYKERKACKRQLYRQHHLPLIEILADDFSMRSKGRWHRKLWPCLAPNRDNDASARLPLFG